MQRDYEVALVMRLEHDDALNENINQIKSWIEEEDAGEVTEIDRWGRRRLAYEIDNQREGYYVFVHARIDPDNLEELERELNLYTPLLRYLIVRKDE